MPTRADRRKARALSFVAPPTAPTTREDVERAYIVHEFLMRLHKGEPEEQILSEAASAGLLEALLTAKKSSEEAGRHGKHQGQLTDPTFNAAVAAPVAES